MNYLIATSRSWNEILARRLEENTGHKFYLVTGKDALNLELIEKIKPRYIFFPHWSYIVPEEIFSYCECVIFHMTDLPYGRGGSPLQNLIKNGYQKTKISALRCVREMDAGPIYLKQSLFLEGSASEIFLRAAEIIEKMICKIVQNEPTPVPQKGEPVFFQRRRPEESNLVEAPIQNLNNFFDFIRMLDAEGYPRAFFELHNHRIELSRVQLEQDRLIGTFTIHKQHNDPENQGGGGKNPS
jgi:methionyl-tRNA formyltransferase